MGIDSRILVTDSVGFGRYLSIRTFDDRLTITDETTGQVMTLSLSTTVEGKNKGDQMAGSVPLETTWGVGAAVVQGAVEELSGEMGALGNIAFIVSSHDPLCPNAFALNSLSEGILRNTSTGIPEIAVAANFPILNQSTTGNASTATKLQTARSINGQVFDGTENITITAVASDVSAWAKSPTKPTYTAAEVNAVSTTSPITVNAAATDLTTAIALLNQIRQLLIDKSLAQ